MPVLPPNVSERNFAKALDAFAEIVGKDWVLHSEEDLKTYLDPFAPEDAENHAASAALAPTSVEQIQEILAVARKYKIPLWTVSCGKNHGYGGAAPRMKGTVVLDLKRMNKVLEVNETLGYAVVEPGVSFFQLYDYIEQRGIKLWLSLPAPGWGSVMGNALDRGIGYTSYGENTAMICGMEILLADGQIVRTGMGAAAHNNAWHLYKYGFGPSWDQVFMQSNFGIVTKIGIWLMPEPEATASMSITVPHESDLPQIIDTIRPLRIGQTINTNVIVANAVRRLASTGTRDQYYEGDGAMPDELITKIMSDKGWNFWEVTITFFDDEDVIEGRLKKVEAAFKAIPGTTFEVKRWKRGEPIENSAKPRPNLIAYQVINWRGGRGGHIGFAPIVAPVGSEAAKVYGLMKKRIRDFGFDYFGGFTFFQRHAIHTSLLIFDQDDPKMKQAAFGLFDTAVREAAAMGFHEYRTHVSWMDLIASQYDYNDHSLMRLNERVKDVLDPDGILAPGKQGIWPRSMRQNRGGKGI
jgi:4-cresol dehydrogenase (hydroxylating) flavoprotein subunit